MTSFSAGAAHIQHHGIRLPGKCGIDTIIRIPPQLVYELYSVGIVVQGNTAVAHYYYSIANEDKEGARETVNGRYTDVLIKDGGQWKFLAWSGGEEETDD